MTYNHLQSCTSVYKHLHLNVIVAIVRECQRLHAIVRDCHIAPTSPAITNKATLNRVEIKKG